MDTIAAIATPAGAGALGVLRLSGADARKAALGFLSGSDLPPRIACFARAASGGKDLDQVVAVYFPGPGSATGEDLVEISAHGSPFIMRRLLEAALAAGCRPAEPGEFTQRTFLNGKLDLAQAEAVGELIRARTEDAHRAALVRLEGGLSRAVETLKAPVLELLVCVEARLDHPEEDIPSIPEGQACSELEACRHRVQELAATHERGRWLADGARICLLGRPNAGKSSLLNALLGEDRAIVCDAPGTTRDTLEEPAAAAGLPAIFVDTAGLRRSCGDAAEDMGMARAERAFETCDLALLVVDGSRAESDEDAQVHRRILARAAQVGRPLLPVLNKADLGLSAEVPGALVVSALRRQGIQELASEIRARLEGRAAEGGVIVASTRQRRSLANAANALGCAHAAVVEHPGRWEDRCAFHLREALRALDEVAGRGAPDEVLREVFSKFCVGK